MNSVKIMLIANAGIMIEYREQQLLVDALHEGHRLYPGTPPAAMQALLDGAPPFKEIKALVFTHNHLDHFSPRLARSVLQRYPDLDFIADEVSVAAMRTAGEETDDPFDHSRMTAMPWQLPTQTSYADGSFIRSLPPAIHKGPFSIQPLPFLHEGRGFQDVANVGLMISVGGVHILYPGDARISPENFAILTRPLPPVDVAVLMFPYISTSRGQRIVREFIKPRNLVVVHWPQPEHDREKWIENAHSYYERTKDSLMQTWFLEHYLDTVGFTPSWL
ncbi:MAG: MBL fold metallo-hydrolase [Saccharofermentanales bacterium]